MIDGLIREGSVACSDEQSSGYFEESTPPSSVVADDVSPAIDTPRESYPSLADTLARIAQVVGEHPRAPDWVLILFFTMVCLRIVW